MSDGESGLTIVLSQPRTQAGDPSSWPTPTPQLMEYGESPQQHLDDGKSEFESMISACIAGGVDPRDEARVLDFGCSNGRVTRWFGARKNQNEVWGCDIQVAKLLWAQENLAPPLRFFVNDVTPHLPFSDGYFNLVIAQSVFTHLQESHLGWLLELIRVTASGGRLFLTVNDARSLDASQTPKAARVLERVFKGINAVAPDLSKVGYLAMNPYNAPGNLAQVYMSEEYIRTVIPPSVEVSAIIPRAYSNVLTAYILKKKSV